MTPREYLDKKYGMKPNDNYVINYRIIEHGSLVQSFNVDEAVKIINDDIEDMRKMFACYDIDVSKAQEAVYKTWDKHLVIWQKVKERKWSGRTKG